ncbi:MAG: BT4734/BF3469 family protein [Kiritimatiellia bacterium]
MKQPNTITGAELGERMVSMYDGVLDKKGKPIAMMEVLDAIKSGYWAEQVEAVRSAKPDAAEKIKSRLPAITVAGVFKTRCKTGLDSSSGCLVLDVDDLATRAIAEALRDALGRDPHVLAAFVSPGGLGVKAVVYIGTCADDAEAKSAWRALAEYLQDAHEVETDPSGKDVCRLCFVSHDPGAVVNLGEVRAFTARAEAAKPAAPKVVNTSQSASIAPDAAVIRSAVAVLDAGCSRADWLAIGCAIKNALGDSGFQIFDSWSATAPEKYDAAETRKLWYTVAADGGVTVGTLYKRAEDAGWINPTGRLALSIRRQQAAEKAEADGEAETDESAEAPAPKPWRSVTDKHAAEAIAGTRLETMVKVLAAVTVPPLPLRITLPKAIALAGCALTQPVEFDRKTESRRGLDLGRNVIATAGGQLLNIWTCIVGPSGCGKDVGNLPFRIALEHGVAIGTAGSAEGLADAFTSNGAGLLTISELGPYLDPKSWQHKATGFLTQAWNQCQAKVVLSARNGDPRDVRFCAPSIIAAVQPAVLAATGDTLLLDSGFLPRFLFSHLPEIHAWRPNTEPIDLAPLSSSFRAYKRMQAARIAVPAGYLQDVMDEFVANDAPIPGHYNRLVNEIAPRVAVMLAADPNRPRAVEIAAEHWQRTAVLARWFFGMAEDVLGTIGEDRYVRKMESRLDRMRTWIKKHPHGVQKKFFTLAFHKGSTAEVRDRDLNELQERGQIVIQKIGGKTMLKPVAEVD